MATLEQIGLMDIEMNKTSRQFFIKTAYSFDPCY